MWAVDFCGCSLSNYRSPPLFLVFWELLSWIFVGSSQFCLSESVDMIIQIFFSSLLMHFGSFYSFHMVKTPNMSSTLLTKFWLHSTLWLTMGTMFYSRCLELTYLVYNRTKYYSGFSLWIGLNNEHYRIREIRKLKWFNLGTITVWSKRYGEYYGENSTWNIFRSVLELVLMGLADKLDVEINGQWRIKKDFYTFVWAINVIMWNGEFRQGTVWEKRV